MKKFGIILVFLMSCFTAEARQKIIRGEAPSSDNPGSYNAVALVKEDGKVFCTGSLVAYDLVVTAKHCLMDKADTKIRLYFGDDTTNPDPSLYRDITEYQVRYPVDWTMTFPSFDVAWVKFRGDLPKTHKPLPVLSHGYMLEQGSRITQVGYGDHNPSVGAVDAGIKLTGQTILKKYIDNARFFHILLFEGEEGQGSCHGDSGGPAYAQINGQWFIVGVTNGFDVVLTPQTMGRTGDPDFPYNVDCSKNQSLYSFLGAHGNWIEETSGIEILKSEIFFDYDRYENLEPQSLVEWCLSRDYGSPQWNLLKILMDIKVDTMPQEDAVDFYHDCEQVASYLSTMEEISLDSEDVMEGQLSFETLNLFPKLKKVSLYNFPEGRLDLSSIKGLELEELRLQNLGLNNLKFLKSNKVKKLSVEQNPLYNIWGLESLVGLESLNVSGTPLKDFTPAAYFQLKELIAVSINSSVIFGLDKLNLSLESLDLRNSIITKNSYIGRFPNLKELKLTGEMGEVNLTGLDKLEVLSLKDFKTGDIIWPESLANLRDLSASQCDLEDISFLSSANQIEKINLTFNRIRNLDTFAQAPFMKLHELNLSANPILNVTPLATLESLKLLRLFRTPLQTGIIPKTEANCPTLTGPEALGTFCHRN